MNKKNKSLLPTPSPLIPKQKGFVWVGILILLVFILALGLALISQTLTTIVQTKKSGDILIAQSLCEAGIEKGIVELNEGGMYSGEEITLETGTAIVTVSDDASPNTRNIESDCTTNSGTKRKIVVKVTAEPRDSGVAFGYAIQVGGFGVELSPNSIIQGKNGTKGNVYISGNLTCGNNSNITGDAILSKWGPDPGQEGTGTINNCNVGGNVSAYSILQSHITGSSESVIWDNRYPPGGGYTPINSSELKEYKNLPISQGTVDIWKGWASEGGTHIGDYHLTTNQTGTIGPTKIQGNLILDPGSVLTVTGVLWVEGNIVFNSGATVQLANTYGEKSGMIIADKPGSEATMGTINVDSNVTINGSGDPKSYIMMLSTNTKSTFSDPAISAGNNSSAVVYYATAGSIEVKQNAHLRAVASAGLKVSNGAVLEYDSGLADAFFSGGPGGSWVVREWKVIYGE